MVDKVRVVFFLSTDVFEDLSKVARELDLELSEVVSSLVEHDVREMGADLITEGVRCAWDFGGEDDDAEDVVPLYGPDEGEED